MEELLHIISGSLHILAAVTWIGSMVYNEFGVKPALKTLGPPKSQALGMMTAHKFSSLTWSSFVVLIITGLYAAFDKKADLTFAPITPASTVLTIKLVLVAFLLAVLVAQVYYYGPKMKQLISPVTPKVQENELEITRTNNTAELLSKLHLTAGILVIILAVILAQILQS